MFSAAAYDEGLRLLSDTVNEYMLLFQAALHRAYNVPFRWPVHSTEMCLALSGSGMPPCHADVSGCVVQLSKLGIDVDAAFGCFDGTEFYVGGEGRLWAHFVDIRLPPAIFFAVDAAGRVRRLDRYWGEIRIEGSVDDPTVVPAGFTLLDWILAPVAMLSMRHSWLDELRKLVLYRLTPFADALPDSLNIPEIRNVLHREERSTLEEESGRALKYHQRFETWLAVLRTSAANHNLWKE